MKQEKLPWLANNPFYTKRFSYYVGRKCRAMTVKDVAKELSGSLHKYGYVFTEANVHCEAEAKIRSTKSEARNKHK